MRIRFLGLSMITASLMALGTVATSSARADQDTFLGHWALTIPGGAAGWLGVVEEDGQLKASLLWGGGSVLPVASVEVKEDRLVVTRSRPMRRNKPAGRQPPTETITARVEGDALHLTQIVTDARGRVVAEQHFTGKQIPPLPPRPDLTQVKFGPAVALFNGKGLTGWRLIDPEQANGWSVEDGVLINRPVHKEGQPHERFGNLRTEQEFEDFKLTLETRVPPGGNSGVYLRGIYEVQVSDSHGQPLDSHNMGAIYSRITPTVAAEKPADQWQRMEMTLVDRHVTVVLNGQTIIDNQPVLGCTGGALWSDEFRPGPIFLQGDHTAVDYRNIVLRPVVK
jgi:hypothetical protein